MPRLNRRSAVLALGAAALPAPIFAADPWDKQPSQWDDKDIQKIISDSPWAKTVSVSIGGPSVGQMGGGGRGGRGSRGGGGGGGMTDASSSAGMGGSPMGGEGGGAMGGGGGMGGGGLAPSITFLIRWQTAKPIKIASVRARLGAEADSSPQAKEFVERQESEYVVAVIMPGMRPPGGGRPGGPQGDRKGPSEDAAEKMKETSWLSWKGHDQVHPTSVTMPREGQSAFIFHFSKQHPIELEDKEVEFTMHRSNLEVKKKFKLKDMVYDGQLAL